VEVFQDTMYTLCLRDWLSSPESADSILSHTYEAVQLVGLHFTDHFSGSGRQCECMCVRTTTVEINILWPRYLARRSPWSTWVKIGC